MQHNPIHSSPVKPLTQKDDYSLLSVMTHLSLIRLHCGCSVFLQDTIARKHDAECTVSQVRPDVH